MKKIMLVAVFFSIHVWGHFDSLVSSVTKEDFLEFAELYGKRPLKNNDGGMKSVGMFWVWYVTKHIAPDLIVESGIWMGQSTWILEQAAPNARIISIDPQLELRKYISSKAQYYSNDFSTIDFGDLSNLVTLAFFDDHQNAFNRIQQAHSKGFKHLLVDDNYPVGSGGHLTLQHCLNDPKKQSLANELKKLMKTYCVLPQLIGNQIVTLYPQLNHTVDSLNIIAEGPLSIFAADALSYRWTTYALLS